MKRIFRLVVDLDYVGWDDEDMEFVVTEQLRGANRRTICTLQVGNAIRMEDIGLLQQIVDDCVLSQLGRTVGLQEQLAF